MAIDLTKEAARRGIAYFLISFVDLCGVMRAKLVPTAAIGAMAAHGAGFAGFATWFDMAPADPDVFAVPDPAGLIRRGRDLGRPGHGAQALLRRLGPDAPL